MSRAEAGPEKIQTYQLIKGKRLMGNVADRGFDAVSFEDIVQEISANLERQRYHVEPDLSKCDLLIMVHYGTTIEFSGDPPPVVTLNSYLKPETEDSEEKYRYETIRETVSESVGWVMASQRGKAEEQFFRKKILGMDGQRDLSATSEEEYVSNVNATEGRYFFVLTAFDYPLLKEGEKKVHWTIRYNMRMIGQSYSDAVKELNLVAGDFFGKDFDGIILKSASDVSNVEMGEIEVVGEEGDSEQ